MLHGFQDTKNRKRPKKGRHRRPGPSGRPVRRKHQQKRLQTNQSPLTSLLQENGKPPLLHGNNRHLLLRHPLLKTRAIRGAMPASRRTGTVATVWRTANGVSLPSSINAEPAAGSRLITVIPSHTGDNIHPMVRRQIVGIKCFDAPVRVDLYPRRTVLSQHV